MWNAREKEKYFGSYFVHVGRHISESPSARRPGYCGASNSIRHGNAMWIGKYFEILDVHKWPDPNLVIH